MAVFTDLSKRLILGRALRSDRLGETLLPKRIALPVFASDMLSSVTYATQEILVFLSLGGLAYLYLTPWLAGAVILLLLVVVASYRQLVRAYPTGGGDYEVASKNIGQPAGLTVASALLVDYVLTVAVSVSAGVDNLISAVPSLDSSRVLLAVLAVLLLTAVNLRGLRESGTAFAIPTYAFISIVLLLILWGLVKIVAGDPPVAESAHYTIDPEKTHIAGFALVFFVLRAFSSGCTALTGVEAIANGVPAFRKPKIANARKTLLAMAVLSMAMFGGITALAMKAKVHYVDPADSCDLGGFDCTTQVQRTVIAQVGKAVFGQSVFFYLLIAAAALILVLAANTAFNGFPLLGSVLAQDRFLPRQLHTRGDRLVFSNGILVLAGFAILLIVAFDASVTRLIQLYIVGVFTSFTLGQTGMVRHWNRELTTEQDSTARSHIRRSRVINFIGAVSTGTVLVIVLITKFLAGAYIVCIAMPVIYALMRAINKHYESVAAELEPDDGYESMLPSRTHAIVLVSRIHKPTLRALNYARAARPSTLEAVTVGVDAEETAHLQSEWDRRGLPVPLKVLDSPFREVTAPIVRYVRAIRRSSPRDVVAVYIPEYVVGHWWEQLLHNQSALRLKTRLLFTQGVMVISVPWQLKSSEELEARVVQAHKERVKAAIASGIIPPPPGKDDGGVAATVPAKDPR
ncbi:amino acid transporter [Motilibacter peucedani]|uniref:Amino acid transporter n=1 Tax=Motilibacter peucedani TaxID=598650 RepID=A0A420XRX3_9ACTN|nr:APC family permease [Motilibacter peucedani]RKS77638.1 amino acid transporter [Motilibacter peucedani]